MQQQIEDDIKSALISGDKIKAESLRFLKSSLINAKISSGHDLNDEEIHKVIRKEVKSRADARDLYLEHNQSERADKEESERLLYSKYLPSNLSQSELDLLICETTKQLKSRITFAELMPLVMKSVAGRSEGKIVAETVRKYLEENK